MPKLVRNRAQCRKCNDTVESKHRHDMVWCKCGAIAVDGGQDYLRRTGKPSDIRDLSEWDMEVESGR